jgi:hypothetical protein
MAKKKSGLELVIQEVLFMKETAIVLITGIIFLLIGIMCLFWPEKIQEFGLCYYARHKMISKFNPFLGWMKTPGYITVLRILGAVAIGGFVLAILAVVKK